MTTTASVPSEQAERQVAARVLDLLGDVVGVLPAAVGEEDRHQRRAERDEAPTLGRSCVRAR